MNQQNRSLYRDVKSQDWKRTCLYIFRTIIIITAGGLFLKLQLWLIGLVISLLFVGGSLLLLVRWHSRTTAYLCPNCLHEFEISVWTDFTSPITLKLLYFLFIMLVSFSSAFAQDLRSKIGQMIVVGYYSSNFKDTLLIDISQRNLGGAILYSWNFNNPQQLQSLTNQLQSNATTPLFIAVDQEGGNIARLNAQNGFKNTYSHYTLGTIFNSEDSTRSTAAKMAQWLYDSGINVNLAPVVDVNVNPQNPAIGMWGRSFSNDPMTVFNHASWFIDEFSNKTIITTLKHFPGHGSAVGDSHWGLTDITHTWADSELVPYEQLIVNGYSEIIMMGHLYNANIDSMFPASLSYTTITSLLKDSLGFNGLVITDCLLMGAIINNYTFEEAIELAINAGNDIMLYRDNNLNNQSRVRQFIDIVEQKVNTGSISQSRIDDAYQKIMNLKQQLTTIGLAYVSNNLPSNIKINNYPNPFNSGTTVEFEIPTIDGEFDVKIFNILGHEVWKKSINKNLRNKYSFYFDAQFLPSGLYFVQAKVNQSFITKKITCLK